MATPAFLDAFPTYIQNISEAIEHNRHHDYRRQLFTEFLRHAYDIDIAELQLEEHITGLRVRGYIDLLYQYLVFEFKRDIDRERADAVRELRTYLHAVSDRRPLGILTDGLRFEVYYLDEGELVLIDEQDLNRLRDDATSVYLWLESYLFSDRDAVPTPGDIVRKFGTKSPVFAASSATLKEMYHRASGEPEVQVKYTEWDRLLSKVYGRSVAAETLFLKHTYLVLLTRIIAYIATQRHKPGIEDIIGVVDGAAFANVARNLAEQDFFSWVLNQEVVASVRELLLAFTSYLGTYDLSRLGEMDLLQRLYQDLIDPSDRHDLGEFYTPDWLAELTLRRANYDPQNSVLDPSCGSGTFLFTTIRLAAESGMNPHELTQWALENIVGVDVHPVAVMTSKVNYVLALERFGGLKTFPGGPITIPVYMADSLLTPERGTGIAPIPVSPTEQFQITEEMSLQPEFNAIVDTMSEYADPGIVTNTEQASAGFRAWLGEQGLGQHLMFWAHNQRLLRTLIEEGRDTIWSYILKNAYRPFYLSERKFDLVAGNPPWLAYRYIRNEAYRNEVRRLVIHYGLAVTNEQRLVTQIELATLFFVFCRDRYMEPGGTVAFVMPRSVITGAQQHRRFREAQPLSEIIDLKDVSVPSESSLKIFGVDSVVLITNAEARMEAIPTLRLSGSLDNKAMSYPEAMRLLTQSYGEYERPRAQEASEYRERALQGATIVPRNLWLVEPATRAINPNRPRLQTDSSVCDRASKEWRDIFVAGEVEARFLYATLLSNDLIPFGVRRFSLAVIPLHQYSHTARPSLLTSDAAFHAGFPALGGWLAQSERLWEAGRAETTAMSLQDRLNYHHTLLDQDQNQHHLLLYNRAGSHISACGLNTSGSFTCYSIETAGFVADSGTYRINCHSQAEANYLTAVLNAKCVSEAIEPHQSRGAFHGARDIHRRPFEVLPRPIPLYDANSDIHNELARLAQECQEIVAGGEYSADAEIGRLRQKVRAALGRPYELINDLVRQMLFE